MTVRASTQIELIAELREQKGWTYRRIAEHLGCSIGAVSWQCLVNGIERPGPKKFGAPPAAGRICRRGNHIVRCFTPDEDRRLVAMEAQGLSYVAIAKALDRKANSIRGRLATLARLEEQSAA